MSLVRSTLPGALVRITGNGNLGISHKNQNKEDSKNDADHQLNNCSVKHPSRHAGFAERHEQRHGYTRTCDQSIRNPDVSVAAVIINPAPTVFQSTFEKPSHIDGRAESDERRQA